MSLHDLDFQTIYNESDDNSRNLYFNGCLFGYLTPENLLGVIQVTVGQEYLHGTFYYKTEHGDLAIRRNTVIQPTSVCNLCSIPLKTGIHYENEYGGVDFIWLRPERRASKGLQLNRLSGRDAFGSSEALNLFLVEVVLGERSEGRWYTSSQGTVFCCGQMFCDTSEFENEMERMIDDQA